MSNKSSAFRSTSDASTGQVFSVPVMSCEAHSAVVTGTGSNVFFTVSPSSSDLMRSERIHQMGIEFIPSDEFPMLDAAHVHPKCVQLDPSQETKSTRVSAHGKNLTCLAPALNEPLLSFAEEQHLFRRMNYLKFSAARLRESLDSNQPSKATMDQIERYLEEAKASRDQIIRANLRLVISNSKKYCSSQYSFEDLVSDGTLALMEAVEKFDYQRGFRFSTYATHAIRRSFFGRIERKQRDRQRFTVTDPEIMMTAPDRSELEDDAPAEYQMMEQIVKSLSEHLTQRELHIIEGRFGLNGRTEPKTLVELSDELGICKERVRQVEGIALKKLHALAVGKSPRNRRQHGYCNMGN